MFASAEVNRTTADEGDGQGRNNKGGFIGCRGHEIAMHGPCNSSA